jgi:hypothetical protein
VQWNKKFPEKVKQIAEEILAELTLPTLAYLIIINYVISEFSPTVIP